MALDFPRAEPPPHIANSDWLNWQWQMQFSLKTLDDFSQYLKLSPAEVEGFSGNNKIFRVQTTPYYVSLLERENSMDPLRRTVTPSQEELHPIGQQVYDPLGERAHSPTPRIIHRYSDRVLFLVTDMCGIYCRYCTRKHFTGKSQAFPTKSEYEMALEYIRKTTGIREVILSGGDPLVLSDSRLEKILTDLQQISHIEIIRIGSRMPVANPMRITPELTSLLRQHQPVYFMTHFNHPRELTMSSAEALGRLVDHGIPVMNQMVLLNGVNNHAAIIQALNRRLLYLRVKPYYMFQGDPSEGSQHLMTSVDQSLAIQRELWGHMSGLAMPNLSLDIPNGGGKVPLVPNFETSRQGDTRRYTGWDGFSEDYISPPKSQWLVPDGLENYQEEWDRLRAAQPPRS